MENKNLNWLISDNTVTVNFEGKTHMVPRTDAYADKLIAALKSKDFSAIPELLSCAARIEKFSEGKFVVRDGEIYIDGFMAPEVLGKKIKAFADAGLPYEPLVKFAQRLQKNPSIRAVTDLYSFLEKNGHPITEDGCFIAYKKVRDNYKDVHSGTYDNSVGKVVSMPRDSVNPDPNVTCSFGLHCCSAEYLAHFGGSRIMELKVCPSAVCAIPTDYQNCKMRVCEYEVISEIGQEHDHSTIFRDTSKPVEYYTNENYVDEDFCNDCDEVKVNCSCIPF